MFQRHHSIHRILADRQTTQIRDVRAAAQLLTEIVNNGANIGAFGTVNFQLQFVTFVTDKQQLIDGNRSRFTRHFNTLTRIFVQLLTLILQRRIH